LNKLITEDMVIPSEHTIIEEPSFDCKKVSFTLRNEVKERKQDCKIDLTDFTFLMPLRIDSENEKRRENAETSIGFILKHFGWFYLPF
jgi:hypothetical protein